MRRIPRPSGVATLKSLWVVAPSGAVGRIDASEHNLRMLGFLNSLGGYDLTKDLTKADNYTATFAR